MTGALRFLHAQPNQPRMQRMHVHLLVRGKRVCIGTCRVYSLFQFRFLG